MSRLKSEKEYQKTKAFHFFQWLNMERDPYLGTVEMKQGDQPESNEPPLEERLAEKKKLLDAIYDTGKNTELKFFERAYRVASVFFCIALLFVLLLTVSYLPETGNPDNPVNNEVAARYLEKGMEETGAINLVTGMILDYRAFDTFGESNVLFIATVTVLILLRFNKKEELLSDRLHEPKNDTILQGVATILVPIIILFGIYIILNGHLSPGGGFSGGAVIGAGLILYLNAFGFAKTERFFTEKTYRYTCFFALSFYCLAKSYSFFTGANHIESGIPTGTAGDILSSGLILPLNICVGLVVACTMYAFYALFRKGGF